jgi:hypothetical protein
MSILITALVVGCGVAVGRLLVQSPRVLRHKAVAPPEAAPKAEPEQPAMLEGFPCQLGDVVMRNAGDEAWLAGALVLSESRDTPVVVVFVCPEAGAMRVVLARPNEEDLLWLSEAKGVVLALGEPATTLEVEGERFERRRRLPLRAERRGTGAPDLGPDVIFAQYAGLADSALVVLAGREKVLALRGEVLPSGSYDVLPRPT